MEHKITCLRCHLRIKDSANFCENCGTKVNSPRKQDHQIEKSEVLDEVRTTEANSKGQNLIFIGLLTLCATTFYYFILRVVATNSSWSFYETMRPFTLFVSGVSAGIALLIAFGMNSGTKKTMAIIFASLYALIHLFWLIDSLLPDDSIFQYLEF